MSSDQPRWPRGAPDDAEGHGQGGRWVDRLSAAIGGAGGALHGLMTHKQVEAYLGRTDYEVFGHAGGANGAVEFRRYSDGTELAYKSIMVFGDADRQVAAEVDTSWLGHALGARVVPVVADPGNQYGLLMQYVHDKVATSDDPQVLRFGRAGLFDSTAASPNAHMIGLLHHLVGNQDVHPGNVLFPEGQEPVGIDHGATFLSGRYDDRGAGFFAALPRDYGTQLITSTVNASQHFTGNIQSYYSRAALEQARQRLQAAKPHVTYAHWQGVMRTLDHLISITPETGGRGLGE